MRRPSLLLPLLAFLAFAAPLHVALAQPSPTGTATAAATPAPDDADRLFRDGNELYKQKRFADAEALFERAFAKKPAHDIAANLAYAEMNQGKLVEAAEHLAYAVRIWPPTGKDDKRQGAVDRLAKVKEGIATLTIEVSVPGARVLVGEREVGTSPIAGEVFAEAGHVVVRVKREGHRDAETAVDVAKGGVETVKLTMEATPVVVATAVPTASASATTTVEPPAPNRLPVYIAFGAGGAGLLLGAVAGGLVAAGNDELSKNCAPSGACPTSASGKLDSTRALSYASTAGFVLAAVGAAAGLTFILIESKPKKTTHATVQVTPGFVSVKGAF